MRDVEAVRNLTIEGVSSQRRRSRVSSALMLMDTICMFQLNAILVWTGRDGQV